MSWFNRAALGAVALVFLSLSAPAQACSDLPNICAMNEAHFREQMDYWATPPWNDGADYEDEDDGGYYYDTGPSYSVAEWQAMVEEARLRGVENQAKAKAELDERLKDPKFAAFWNGEWLERSSPPGQSGQFCTATFLYRGQGAMIIGPGGMYDGAFLALFGPNGPAPIKIRKLKATLEQTDDQPATLTAFNMALPWAKDYGMVLFYVAKTDALLNGMLEEQWFRVSVGDQQPHGTYPQTLIDLTWHSGTAARDTMRDCLAAKTG